ncbi:MAG: hypothetical protein K6F51_07255 [Acetatifactor sp.]|nr:hypothetical protein [Acetatifactor sp.]
MEHGRLDARAEMADTVLQEIERIKPQLLKNAQAENDVKYYPSEINDLKTERGFVISEGLMEGVFRGFLKGLGVCLSGQL